MGLTLFSMHLKGQWLQAYQRILHRRPPPLRLLVGPRETSSLACRLYRLTAAVTRVERAGCSETKEAVRAPARPHPRLTAAPLSFCCASPSLRSAKREGAQTICRVVVSPPPRVFGLLFAQRNGPENESGAAVRRG